MTIDFISATLSGGGAERVLVLLADGFVEKGHDVSIITFGGGDRYGHNQRVKRVRLHDGRFKNHTIRRFVNLLDYYRIRDRRPDVIISFLPPVSFVSIMIARFYGIKIISSEHINHLQVGSARDQFTRKFLYKFSNYLTVLTQFDVPYYNELGVNVKVMPNPCTFKELGDNSHQRRKDIVAVGSLERYHHKGFDTLIQIMANILPLHPQWSLKIIGPGEKGKEYLTGLAEENKVSDRIEFMGFRNDVRDIMRTSAIFVLPSRFEGLPMVLLEAMSQGMACIAFDCKTGPSDIINQDFDNGVLIEDQNIKLMQEGINKLMMDDAYRKKLGENALRSLDRFKVGEIVNKWEELFHNISN